LLRADMVSVHIRYLTPYPIPIDPVQTYPQRHEGERHFLPEESRQAGPGKKRVRPEEER